MEAEKIRAEVEAGRERLEAGLRAGRPEHWQCDRRTRDVWCLGVLIDERFAGLDPERRRELGWADRRTLLDGLIGAVHGEWAVYVSRQIPQGYFHDSEGRAEILHPARAEGERRVAKVDPEEFMRQKVHFSPLVQRDYGSREWDEMRKPAEKAG